MTTAQQLGPDDEPQHSGAVVAVHYGDYRRRDRREKRAAGRRGARSDRAEQRFRDFLQGVGAELLADTSDGLLAREKLPDIVDALLGMLGEPWTEWAALTDKAAGHPVTKPCDDERDAREFVALMPPGAWVVVRRTRYSHAEPWVEVPTGTEAGDV